MAAQEEKHCQHERYSSAHGSQLLYFALHSRAFLDPLIEGMHRLDTGRVRIYSDCSEGLPRPQPSPAVL
eukprot:6029872-Pleurochrysis_carterae.AAC.1